MFWDSSALVPLIVPESHSAALTTLASQNHQITIWWGTPLECHAALHRRHRDRAFAPERLREALDRLRLLGDHADVMAPTDDVRHRAARLVSLHPLRAADALQLAAALLWCEEQPTGEAFVSLDDRLRDAAQREGFVLVP